MVLPDPNNRAHSDWDTRVAAWSSVANAFAPGMFPVLVIDRTHPQTRRLVPDQQSCQRI